MTDYPNLWQMGEDDVEKLLANIPEIVNRNIYEGIKAYTRDGDLFIDTADEEGDDRLFIRFSPNDENFDLDGSADKSIALHQALFDAFENYGEEIERGIDFIEVTIASIRKSIAERTGA